MVLEAGEAAATSEGNKMKLLDWRNAEDGFNYILTVEHRRQFWWFWRLFDKSYPKTFIREYYGGGTVWRTFPGFRQCDTSLEMVLSDFHAYIEAHESGELKETQ